MLCGGEGKIDEITEGKVNIASAHCLCFLLELSLCSSLENTRLN